MNNKFGECICAAADEFSAWEARMEVVKSIYMDRVAKRPNLPWGDDQFRRFNYSADWEALEWSVDDGGSSIDQNLKSTL